MFFQINSAFLLVKFKGKHGVKNIPLLEITQGLGMDLVASNRGADRRRAPIKQT
jgi:hypothetical protein